MSAKITILILIAMLTGCAHLVPSAGLVHQSNPNAGRASPHPDRFELSCDFLGGGATAEFDDTDIHVWFGVRRCNDGVHKDTVPAFTTVVAHKFKMGMRK